MFATACAPQTDALYREAHAATMRAPPPPVLSQVGEAATATTRDSWIPKSY